LLHISQAWWLLDKICQNAESWYLCSKEKKKVDPDYDSIKFFYKSSKMKESGNELNVGTDPALQILKGLFEFL
jgi:hypothetical protein